MPTLPTKDQDPGPHGVRLGPSLGALPPLPHGAPFRLIDRVLHADLLRGHLIAMRRLTHSDALWPGDASPPQHASTLLQFPRPLLIEALCQAAACLNALQLAPPEPAQAAVAAAAPESLSADRSASHRGYLVAISGFRFPSLCQQTHPADLAAAQAAAQAAEQVAAQVADRAGPPAEAQAHIGDTLCLVVQRRESRGALVAFDARATLHRGLCDPTGLLRAALALSEPDSAEPGPPNPRDPADLDARTNTVAAGRLLFAVTLA